MPSFSLADYRLLLESLLEAGYEPRQLSRMPEPVEGRTLYLRHDVDFHVYRQDEIARVDAECGIASTFYVQVSGYYNPALPENRAVLDAITALGHEVGLHYDLRSYPTDPVAAREQLDFEAAYLSRLVGAPVRTIALHEPSAQNEDWFGGAAGYVHPHDPRWGEGLAYISDSCRAWRDERLLEALHPGGPRRLLLTLHGELWIAPQVDDRLDYLREVSAPSASHYADRYFGEYMDRVWRTHEAVRMDADRRAIRD
jgi:hypothetical protein